MSRRASRSVVGAGVRDRSNDFIRIEEVESMTGWDRVSIKRSMAAGAFPSARVLGPRCFRWVHGEVSEWVAKHGRQEAPMPPPPPPPPKLEMFGPPRPNPYSLLNEEQILAQAEKFSASGVYFLLKADRIVYIGQSAHVHLRVGDHRSTKDFDRWFWLPVPSKRRALMEERYIRHFKPPLNIALCGPKANRYDYKME